MLIIRETLPPLKVEMVLTAEPLITLQSRRFPSGTPEDEDDDSNEHSPISSQHVTENVKPASPAHNVQEDEHEDQTVEEVADGDCEADGDGDGDGEGEGYEEDQIGGILIP
ncbi:hypothetical protein Pst134EA_031711 [Puccinia striiformis f. sp. tritici]|uniref:uncharacterized protein n=1 Tax=Puccinia striiformis f. sp. tritici TaxID=168172 RepID=UPI00200828D1|nr:uncharacterized protein Pst134EA_031711 [Puccinia striiformis f. sp. tritici]KAH9442648.1 hypothetical protein Pst134EA_031711 [Puccinia striiformis f. sp. tritici]